MQMRDTMVKKEIARDVKFAQEIEEEDAELGLGNDTYAMAFKAFNWGAMQDTGLEPRDVFGAFRAALTVFSIQVLMIIFIGTVVMSDDFDILLPKNLAVLGARFVCTILMHLQVEGDLRQGLQMMKYVTNHASEFSAAR